MWVWHCRTTPLFAIRSIGDCCRGIELPAADRTAPPRFPWRRDGPIVSWVVACSCEHYAGHAAQVPAPSPQ